MDIFLNLNLKDKVLSNEGTIISPKMIEMRSLKGPTGGPS